MTESSSDFASRLQSAVESTVRNFQPNLSLATVLDLLKQQIIDLREKGATFPEIKNLLHHHGIRVSEQTLGRFCRQHAISIKRSRLEVQIPRAFATTPLPTETNSTTTPALDPQKKLRSLRGPV
jgi:hypothetical protein